MAMGRTTPARVLLAAALIVASSIGKVHAFVLPQSTVLSKTQLDATRQTTTEPQALRSDQQRQQQQQRSGNVGFREDTRSRNLFDNYYGYNNGSGSSSLGDRFNRYGNSYSSNYNNGYNYGYGSDYGYGYDRDGGYIQGGDRLTRHLHPHQSADRAKVSIASDRNAPVMADIDLWQGPNHAPQRLRVFSEDGRLRPFHVDLATRSSSSNHHGGHSVSVTNRGPMEFPIDARVRSTDSSRQRRVTPNTLETIHSGSLRTFAFDYDVRSIQIDIETDGLPLEATVELWQGPGSESKIIADISADDGWTRPFSGVIETPTGNSGGVICIRNSGPMAFPIKAAVTPLERGPPVQGYDYDYYGNFLGGGSGSRFGYGNDSYSNYNRGGSYGRSGWNDRGSNYYGGSSLGGSSYGRSGWNDGRSSFGRSGWNDGRSSYGRSGWNDGRSNYYGRSGWNDGRSNYYGGSSSYGRSRWNDGGYNNYNRGYSGYNGGGYSSRWNNNNGWYGNGYNGGYGNGYRYGSGYGYGRGYGYGSGYGGRGSMYSNGRYGAASFGGNDVGWGSDQALNPSNINL